MKEQTNIGKDILDVYPDAIYDPTKKGPLKSYIIPSEQMIVETTTEDKIVRVLDPLNIDDDEDSDSGFLDDIILF